MASFSFTKLIFFFLAITLLISIVNAETSKPYELVENVCSEMDNVNFCLEVLKSDSRSKFAKHIPTLTKIAVSVATKYSTKTRNYFQRVKTGPPSVLKSLEYCISVYNYLIRNFMTGMKGEECELIGYDIHVACWDGVERCQTNADENGAHHSFITTYNNVTQEFCWLCESLANRMCLE